MAQQKVHRYRVGVQWQGNRGSGTSGYQDYDREYQMTVAGKPAIAGSADPAFLGNAGCWNPEEMLVGALAACHKLWYLHLCADAGVVVLAYEDKAEGDMPAAEARFTRVTLRPCITLAAGSDEATARDLHDRAHEKCFIARSINFEVNCEPTITFKEALS